MKDDDQKPEGVQDEDTETPEDEVAATPGEGEKPAAQPVEAPENIEELRQKARERDQYLDLLQRTTADFFNYQKRVRKDHDTMRQAALREFVEAILPALDNLDHAIAAAKNSADQALLTGVKLARDEVLRILGNFGVERMTVVGGKFDPNLHEAVLVEQTDKAPHQTVLEEMRAGYTLAGKAVRAAQVKISHSTKPAEG